MSLRINDPKFLVNFWPLQNNANPVIRADAMTKVGTPGWSENPFGKTVLDVEGVLAGYYGTEISQYQFTNFSYGCWCVFSTIASGPEVLMGFSNANSPSPPAVETLFLLDSGERVDLRSSDGTTGNTVGGVGAVNDGSLHHFMGVFDDTDIILYRDGEINASIARTMTGSPIGDEPVSFGIYGDGSAIHDMNGKVWGGRFYNVPLTGDEVKYIYDGKI